MNKLILSAIFSASLLFTACEKKEATATPAATAPVAKALEIPTDAKDFEVACGSCIYKLDEVEVCETWVKVGDKSHKLTGAPIDAHNTGLCKHAAQAKLVGEVKDGKFVATFAALAPDVHAGHDHGSHEDHDHSSHEGHDH
ncbi:MAG: hypothetical protein HRT88_05590 [Lentisphaeraceae bacterium]|nr:hypothetical protein [Lentisphaeraceae bacterium]